MASNAFYTANLKVDVCREVHEGYRKRGRGSRKTRQEVLEPSEIDSRADLRRGLHNRQEIVTKRQSSLPIMLNKKVERKCRVECCTCASRVTVYVVFINFCYML